MAYARQLNELFPLRTERLVLRPFSLQDSESLYRIHSDPLATQHAGGVKSRRESLASLDRIIRAVDETGFGALAVVESVGGDVIGWCGIRAMTIARSPTSFEVFYALRPDKWGQGLAVEAARPLMDGAFSLRENPLQEIFGLVYPENVRSVRVLQKLGMTFIESLFDQPSQRIASLYSVDKSQFLRTSSSVSSK